MDTQDQELLELLECPVCFEYMTSPIRLCAGGHSTCSKCRERLAHCGICREGFIETRNFGLENLSRKLKHPCKYKDSGCELAFNLDQMAAHETECEYGRKCPIYSCTWKGLHSNMKAHILTEHSNSAAVLETTGKYRDTHPDMNRNSKWYQVVIMQDELFFNFTMTTDDTLYSVMLYVGDEIQSKKFKYKMSFTTTDGSKKLAATLVTPSYFRDISDVFRKEDCVIVTYNFVKQCVNAEQGFVYEVKIFQV